MAGWHNRTWYNPAINWAPSLSYVRPLLIGQTGGESEEERVGSHDNFTQQKDCAKDCPHAPHLPRGPTNRILGKSRT